MGEDEDGDTLFQITKFIQIRPDNYKAFYMSFFQDQTENMEHFGFMEFLNLAHSSAHDSVQAQKKEMFDNYADIAMRNKKEFKDEDNARAMIETNDVQEEFTVLKQEDVGEPIELLKVTKKTAGQIRDDYFNSYNRGGAGSPGDEEMKFDDGAGSEEERKSRLSGLP